MKSSPLVCQVKGKVVTPLMFLLGAALLLVNVMLVQQNKKLRALAGRPDLALEIKPGTTLPPLEGVDGDGVGHTVDYGQDSRKTVLLVLAPRCQACEENMPNWAAIAKGIDQSLFRLVEVSLQSENLKEYVSRHGINRVTILTKIDPKYRVAYNLALTPQVF